MPIKLVLDAGHWRCLRFGVLSKQQRRDYAQRVDKISTTIFDDNGKRCRTMRDKVLAALSTYAEGGTVRAAWKKHGIEAAGFYGVLEADPTLLARYRFIQKSRADMFIDEAYGLVSDDDTPAVEGTVSGEPSGRARDPRMIRVAADVRMKLAGFYDRPRFGEKIGVEIEAGPNLAEALQAAKQRVPLPPRDLAVVTDVEYRALPAPVSDGATDKQSDAKPASSDPLGIFDDE